jgi:hypothetical protein
VCHRMPTLAACSAFLFVLSTNEAHAYVDPSAGGTLVQFFAGGLVAGVLMIVRLSWHTIASKLGLPNGRARARDDGNDGPKV